MNGPQMFNPYSAESVRRILKHNNLWLNKKRGQNYLIAGEIADRITGLVSGGMPVFEVGSGLGALTIPLSQKFKTLSIEIDNGIFEALNKGYQHANLTLLHADFLEFDFGTLPEDQLFFISNLPYSISGEAIRSFIDSSKFREGVVMVQNEFADRLTALPGGPSFGVLSILSHYFLKITMEFQVTRNYFFPEPSVDSAVIRMEKKNCDLPQDAFNVFLRKSFLSRRKTILNNLKELGFTAEDLQFLGVDPKLRPEQLPLKTWEFLFNKYKEILSPQRH